MRLRIAASGNAPRPFLYRGDIPKRYQNPGLCFVVGKKGWALSLLKMQNRVEKGDLVITWEQVQNSALDTSDIAEGSYIGNVIVQRRVGSILADAAYDLTFAFIIHSFIPGDTLCKHSP